MLVREMDKEEMDGTVFSVYDQPRCDDGHFGKSSNWCGGRPEPAYAVIRLYQLRRIRHLLCRHVMRSMENKAVGDHCCSSFDIGDVETMTDF